MDIGESLGGYELLREVGRGGMGVVYAARAPAGQIVAVKAIHKGLVAEDTRERLRREVDAVQRVSSPAVAQVLASDIEGKQPYVVTEFVEGPTLTQLVSTYGPLDRAQLATLGSGLGRGLAAIHAAGVVHRDLKPSNILMRSGQPVIIDFGIAHTVDAERMTHTGLVMGTPGYLAPEVLNNTAITPAADWWAWAAVMVYAATGRHPFGTGAPEAILARVYRGSADLTGVPHELVAVLGGALSVEPENRPTPPQLRVATEELANSATTALPAGNVPHSSNEADADPTRVVAPSDLAMDHYFVEPIDPAGGVYFSDYGQPNSATDGQTRYVTEGSLPPWASQLVARIQMSADRICAWLLAAIAVILGATSPPVVWFLVGVTAVVARTVATSAEAVDRAVMTGATSSAGRAKTLAWIAAPGRLTASAFAMIPTLILALVVANIVDPLVTIVVQSLGVVRSGELLGAGPFFGAVSGMIVYLLILWRGRHGDRVHRGSQLSLEALTLSTKRALFVVSLLVLVVISSLIVLGHADFQPSWVPLGKAPWELFAEVFR